MSKEETYKFTPTEELVLDALTARIRLGENVWTFDSKLRPTLVKLRDKGLINFKSAPVENCELAWPTDEGKILLFSDRYTVRLPSKKLAAHQDKLRKQAKKLKRGKKASG